MAEDYATNLLRGTMAHVYFQSAMLASQQMFSKPYFALGIAEKIAVDQAVYGHLVHFYQMLTPEFFVGQQQLAAQPVGFGIPKADPTTP